MKRPSTLQLALGISIALHAGLLTLRLVDPEGFNRVFKDTALEVILVNAKSNERPTQARAIAQSSLAGGGDSAAGRATTPLPPAVRTEPGQAAEDTLNKIEAMQKQQAQLLAQIKQELAVLPKPDLLPPNPNPTQAEREQQRKQLIKLLAEIEKQINEQNARPKKRYISPATREASYAIYYDTLRRKIEDKGTNNFPQVMGRKLYGELTMILTVNFDGRVLGTEVVVPSSSPLLDRQAQAIVKSTTFGRFTETMRRQADQLVLVSRFKFTRDETLEAQVLGR